MRRRKPRKIGSRQTQHHRGKNRYVSMLDMKKVERFRYYAKEMLGESGLDEKVWTPILGTIVAKATTKGIMDAHEYLQTQEDAGVLTPDLVRDLHRLLDRNKRWR